MGVQGSLSQPRYQIAARVCVSKWRLRTVRAAPSQCRRLAWECSAAAKKQANHRVANSREDCRQHIHSLCEPFLFLRGKKQQKKPPNITANARRPLFCKMKRLGEFAKRQLPEIVVHFSVKHLRCLNSTGCAVDALLVFLCYFVIFMESIVM